VVLPLKGNSLSCKAKEKPILTQIRIRNIHIKTEGKKYPLKIFQHYIFIQFIKLFMGFLIISKYGESKVEPNWTVKWTVEPNWPSLTVKSDHKSQAILLLKIIFMIIFVNCSILVRNNCHQRYIFTLPNNYEYGNIWLILIKNFTPPPASLSTF